MSKKAPAAPTFQESMSMNPDGSYTRTYMDNGVVKTATVLTPEQEERQNWANEERKIVEGRLYNPSEDDTNSWQNYAQGRKDLFRSQYSEMADEAQRKAIENVAARFGTLNTSATADALGKLQKINDQAYADISKNYDLDMQNQEDAYNSRQMNLLNYLNGNLNQINQDGYNGIANANNLTNMGNNFNLTNYQNQLAAAQMQNSATQGYLNTGAQVAATAAVVA
jgi:hypothetical protein